jgi:hypothetical protein
LVTRQKFKEYLNAKNLNYFDAVFLYTQGEFDLTAEQKADLLSFVRDDGKGVLVAHSGMDFNRWVSSRRENDHKRRWRLARAHRHVGRGFHQDGRLE